MKNIIQPVNYLRMIRRRVGLTQEELAILLGHKGHSNIAQYERELRTPNRDNLLLLEEIFRTDVAGLYPGDAKRLLPGGSAGMKRVRTPIKPPVPDPFHTGASKHPVNKRSRVLSSAEGSNVKSEKGPGS